MTRSRHVRLSTRSPAGLTIIELLVAMMLATFLIVGTMGLSSALSRQCHELVESAQPQPWIHLLAAGVRRDLSNARHIAVLRDRLVLTGYLGTRAADPHGTLRAAEVTYQLVSAGDYHGLVREERPLDLVSNVSPSRQLVASGISGFQFVMPATPSPPEQYVGAMPSSCRLRFFTRAAATPVAEVIWCQ